MPQIKSIKYKAFLDGKFIEFIGISVLDTALNNINSFEKHKNEARVLLLLMYYTGARPIELLNLKGENITAKDNDIYIQLYTKKGGVNRTLNLPKRLKYITEIWRYSSKVFPTLFLFPNFRSTYTRVYQTKKGEIKNSDEISNKLRYYFTRWFINTPFEDIPPYYLRHNLFSLMADNGASTTDLKYWKGAKREQSVYPYTHLSKDKAKKISKFLPR